MYLACDDLDDFTPFEKERIESKFFSRIQGIRRVMILVVLPPSKMTRSSPIFSAESQVLSGAFNSHKLIDSELTFEIETNRYGHPCPRLDVTRSAKMAHSRTVL
jgi:hypothetical protein